MSKSSPANIQVVCRFRPQNKLEHEQTGGKECVQLNSEQECKVSAEERNHTFTFDHIFGPKTQQENIYQTVGSPIVADIFNGINGTVFVYGQTGAGKTYTMMGPNDDLTGFCDDPETKGITPRIIDQIFKYVEDAAETMEFQIKVGYIEIYLEKIRDLFNPEKDNLTLKEDRESGRGVFISDVTEAYVGSAEEVFMLMKQGAANRAVASTRMNQESSRSHSIFMITVIQKDLEQGETKEGRLYLVDLAGSEKVSKTGAAGHRLAEAKNINKSLSALGNVINSLTDGKSRHIPYRDSKLTRLLQDSLGGNSRTTLIINCSMSVYNASETLSTCRFGNRAKSIKNKPKVNRELSVRELTIQLNKKEKEMERMQEYIASLEDELKLFRASGAKPAEVPQGTEESSTDISNLPNVTKMRDRVEELENKLKEESEEKNKLLEDTDSLQEQLEEKRMDLERYSSYEQELEQLREQYEEMEKENGFLVNKLADVTFLYEKAKYERKEKALSLESMTVNNKQMESEVTNLKEIVSSLRTQLIKKIESEKSLTEKLEAYESGSYSAPQTLKQQQQQQQQQQQYESADASPASDDNINNIENERNGSNIREAKSDAATVAADNSPSKTSTEAKPHLSREAEERLEEENKSLKLQVQKLEFQMKEMQQRLNAREDNSILNEGEELKEEMDDEEDITSTTHETDTTSSTTTTTPAASSDTSNADVSTEHKWKEEVQRLKRELQQVRHSAAKERQEFEKVREAHIKDLTNRCQKVIELEMSLDEARDMYKQLLVKTSKNVLQQKVTQLEEQNEKLSKFFQNAYSENSSIRLEVQLAEKKLNIREDRIRHLEFLLDSTKKSLKSQEQHYEQEIKALKEELNKYQKLVNATADISSGGKIANQPKQSGPPISKISRPIRGGGGKKHSNSPRPYVPTGPGNSEEENAGQNRLFSPLNAIPLPKFMHRRTKSTLPGS